MVAKRKKCSDELREWRQWACTAPVRGLRGAQFLGVRRPLRCVQLSAMCRPGCTSSVILLLFIFDSLALIWILMRFRKKKQLRGISIFKKLRGTSTFFYSVCVCVCCDVFRCVSSAWWTWCVLFRVLWQRPTLNSAPFVNIQISGRSPEWKGPKIIPIQSKCFTFSFWKHFDVKHLIHVSIGEISLCEKSRKKFA